MSRRDALLRLTKSLMARRGELRKRLGGELSDLGSESDNLTSDSADLAFGASSDELSSQLAELESRELVQIEKALVRLMGGGYGSCEHCTKKIPLARLNALPFSTTCVECQRDMEGHGGANGRGRAGGWDMVKDGDAGEDKSVNLSALEMDLSK